ncbi:MAG: Gx transporter family protein [Treponema sp.]|nr:Gx transporter family protein [Treponema sp.]
MCDSKLNPTQGSGRTKLITFFSALCLFLSAVEYAIPKPLPFLRLGLANLPVILSLSVLTKKEIALVVFFKIVAQGVISGTLFSYIFVFSAAGSFSSALAMILVYTVFKSKISSVGISLAGALANNCAQLLVARFFLFGKNAKYIAPVLLVTGFATGAVLGIFTEIFRQKSRWLKLVEEKNAGESFKNEDL